MSRKLHIKKGDTVYINSGESKGHTGKVLEVIVSKEKAIVEGANLIKKHTKPNSQLPEGGIVEKEAPIHISNLNVIDPQTKKATKIGRRRNSLGKLVRFAKKSGEDIN